MLTLPLDSWIPVGAGHPSDCADGGLLVTRHRSGRSWWTKVCNTFGGRVKRRCAADRRGDGHSLMDVEASSRIHLGRDIQLAKAAVLKPEARPKL